ncbi:MAG: DNA starvation/stationary phase protection protein Dps [Anaerolineales bacterium]|jgi:starvation-inducible DNA-binding protein
MATKVKEHFKTRNDIPMDTQLHMIDVLNAQLADTFDMFSLIKQAHWNVKGSQFIALHKLFDEIAEGLLGYVDMIAERATALGGVALGTVRMAAESTRLEAYPTDIFDSMGTVELVADRMASLAKSTRMAADDADDIHDMDTNDMLIEISRDLDKWLWFLEAHLQG